MSIKSRYEVVCELIDIQLLAMGYITLADVKKLCGYVDSEISFIDQVYGIVVKADGSTDVRCLKDWKD